MRWLALLGSSWVLGACVSNTIVLESNDDTTGPVATDAPTMDGPLTTTTTGPTPPSTSTTGPSSTVTTIEPPPPIPDFPPDAGSTDTDGLECDPPCPRGEVCVGGLCFDEPDCGFDGPWLPCLLPDGSPDDAACGTPDQICLADGDPASVGICATLDCQDECDCPLAPAIPNPPMVGCEDVTGTGELICYLDCSSGQSCPEDMMCLADFICIYPPPP
ncbi:MAG: hypothetical protein AB1Z98_28615 [Nannocystaceae bacterium]